jgi:hypothetical protein
MDSIHHEAQMTKFKEVDIDGHGTWTTCAIHLLQQGPYRIFIITPRTHQAKSIQTSIRIFPGCIRLHFSPEDARTKRIDSW